LNSFISSYYFNLGVYGCYLIAFETYISLLRWYIIPYLMLCTLIILKLEKSDTRLKISLFNPFELYYMKELTKYLTLDLFLSYIVNLYFDFNRMIQFNNDELPFEIFLFIEYKIELIIFIKIIGFFVLLNYIVNFYKNKKSY
jgi:hypothetical protein